jgi:MinD superfamily P-loop ATPase
MKIAIASGKGGTGKTTLATNLAAFLSRRMAVVLTDLDVEEPNSGLFINGEQINRENKHTKVPEWQKEQCTLCGKCKEVCNFNAITQIMEEILVFPKLCHSCYACSELCPVDALPMVDKKMGVLKHLKSDNLDFVESKLDIGEEQAVPLIAQTLDYIDSNFNKNILKLFDSPPGTSCPVIEATKGADMVFLVSEPTPFGLHDLKLSVETMRKLKKEFYVIINRDGIGNQDVYEYCQDENIEVLAQIPDSRKIAELYSSGELLFDHVAEVKEELEKIDKFITAKMKGGSR